MTRKNKLLIFGTMLIIATVGQAKAKNLKNENTAVFIEENEKEANDDIFIEFTEEKNEKAPDKSINVVSYTNLKTNKKNKKDENKYVAFEQDNYGILAANLEELDEDYIVSSQVFELTGIKDSLEPLNRRMYAFNTQLDRKVLYPASRVYSAVVPKPIRKGISNFYNNFNEIPTFVNSVLQLKPGKAVNALGRFFVNSTVGVLGVADVATKFGMKKDPETMGDTLGHYGVRGGSYLILPVFGPSNLRDAFGTAVDTLGEGAVRGLVEDKLFFDTGVFDKNIYGSTRPIITGLNARSMLSMRYGDLNSPFEYDLIKALYYNYRKIRIIK